MEIELKENERIDDLEFKNLKIIQNTKGFCFGIDAVLLSDFAKNIKKNAKAALKQILMDPDYQFVTDHESFLGRIQTACMRVRPDEVTGRVRKLQEAIENNDFPGMRRYADSDPVIAAAAVCRAEMEPALDDLNPF